jgi:hypothetical protein
MKSSRYAMLLLVQMSNRGQKDTLAETIKYKFPQVNIYELFFYLVMPWVQNMFCPRIIQLVYLDLL